MSRFGAALAGVVALACASGGSELPPDGTGPVDAAGVADASAVDAPVDGAVADAAVADAALPDAPPAPPADAAVTPPVCGNGVVEAGEECDDGNLIDTDRCRVGCVWARCGDGVVRTGVEECDDGNMLENDGCSSTCLPCSGGSARFSWALNGHCYTRHDGLVTWAAARDACTSVRQHLVTFELAAENDVVNATLGTGANHWIGFSDLAAEGTWAWVTGQPVIYTKWAAGEPNDWGGNEDCAEMYVDGVWNDLNCGDARPYLCEDPGWAIRTEDRHAYRFVYHPRTWGEALADCASLGGHLATITSAAEHDFVWARITTNMWIGGTDSAAEGVWTWATGEPFVFTAWGADEPNDVAPGEDCLEYRVGVGWNDLACGTAQGYVCEID